MNKKRKRNASKVCDRCRKPGVRDVRRTKVYKGIVIENIPAASCMNCGEELYDLATVQLIEQIVAKPEVYTTMVKLPVARIGEGGEPMTPDEIYEYLGRPDNGEEEKDSEEGREA